MPDCRGCAAFFESSRKMEEEGRRHDGETLTVTGISTLSFTETSREVRVDVRQNAVPVLDKTGHRLRIAKADQGSFVLTLTFDEHWLVERLQVVKE